MFRISLIQTALSERYLFSTRLHRQKRASLNATLPFQRFIAHLMSVWPFTGKSNDWLKANDSSSFHFQTTMHHSSSSVTLVLLTRQPIIQPSARPLIVPTGNPLKMSDHEVRDRTRIVS